MIKRWTVLLILLGLAASAFAEKRPLRIVTQATYPPFEYMDHTGEIKGFDIAVMQALCKRMQRRCEFYDQAWDSLISSLKMKKYDAIMGAMSITDERKKQVTFTDPYYVNTVSFIAQQSASFEINPSQLAGKRIGVQLGTTLGDFLRVRYPKVSVKTYKNEEDTFLDLISGRLDAVLGDAPLVQSWISEPGREGFKVVGGEISDPETLGVGYGIALHKESTDLLEEMNFAINDLLGSKEYEEIKKLYLEHATLAQEDISVLGMIMQYRSQILSGTLLTLGLAIFSVIFGFVMAICFTAGELSQHRVFRASTKVLTVFLRGLPELLVIFTIYFGGTLVLKKIFGSDSEMTPFVAGVLALGLIFAAYACQVLRGAIAAVPPGQVEAARALGLSSFQAARKILLPQAWFYALPGLGNLWLVLLKDTALVSLIGVSDLMNVTKVASASTLQPLVFYFTAAWVYLLVTAISEKILQNSKRKIGKKLVVNYE